MRPLNLTQDQRNAEWSIMFSVNRWEVYMGKCDGSLMSAHYTKTEVQEFLKQNKLKNVKIHNVKRWLSE